MTTECLCVFGSPFRYLSLNTMQSESLSRRKVLRQRNSGEWVTTYFTSNSFLFILSLFGPLFLSILSLLCFLLSISLPFVPPLSLLLLPSLFYLAPAFSLASFSHLFIPLSYSLPLLSLFSLFPPHNFPPHPFALFVLLKTPPFSCSNFFSALYPPPSLLSRLTAHGLVVVPPCSTFLWTKCWRWCRQRSPVQQQSLWVQKLLLLLPVIESQLTSNVMVMQHLCFHWS